MTASPPSEDWARRAARVGRCVAKFRLTSKPQVQGWRTSRVTSGGARCIGCDDPFQPGEPHVEIVAARTLLLELHDECFDVWVRFGQGGPGPAPSGQADAEEDDDEDA